MKFTKGELKELILTLIVGSWVREAVDEYNGEEYKSPSRHEKLLKYFLELSEKLGYEDLFEKFKGELIVSNSLGKEEDKIMEIFHEDVFWEELQTRMGKRDFFKSITKEEKEGLKKNFCLPERVHKIYEKYEKEFEKYGIDRLEIAVQRSSTH
ncbi:MAG: hypothetical protein UT58_C0004G0026 [Microgenomates group bacterium GW2011_GWC1_39_7b]|uniref:Uncharacterized protein n=3 Tax=Candidatus Woeseibacteriota TaxID=1752722 RepID=A0A0G0LL18_9BACT|nr:MAG: hypothetical protein UT17_C0004G0080 [Candidatus Woesebacteria bacterium GW2011_GWB1_39_10]KKR26883.1 MAG: hypothetical protein UT58_C0004G0026 [Microgenomates group bacterium GW2011_GWC1_39_7b]KKR73912.1 MAG: hypothetical protein UU16_C0010G0006 [Candidatus Woesebacteria bacterium GW2011_GWA2_40_7]KKS90724.1 MAG: hypothetical protein UV66_C0001G0081 [Candidatus Woesebacteria bacterium GW2011_GWA1_43_12]